MQKTLLVILAGCALLAGFMFSQFTQTPPAQDSGKLAGAFNESAQSVLGQSRPAFTLNDLTGRPRNIAEWDGRPLIINFWATWCTPCREEIPELIHARQAFADQRLEIIGIAIDLPDMVNEFASELKIPYPLLVGNEDAVNVNERYGNRIGALPYTVFIDSNGIIQHTHTQGALEQQQLHQLITALLHPAKSQITQN